MVVTHSLWNVMMITVVNSAQNFYRGILSEIDTTPIDVKGYLYDNPVTRIFHEEKPNPLDCCARSIHVRRSGDKAGHSSFAG
jgi:hypothetical protein